MPFLRFLVALASAAAAVSGWLLQHGPRDALTDLCPSVQPWLHPCPAWLNQAALYSNLPQLMYGVAVAGLLFVIWPLFRGALDQPPETMLADFIQRGRDLHERCRKEGDQAVVPDIDAWTREVSKFLRRLGHRYVVAFGDLSGMQLFASQYDTAITLEIRKRIQRLTEFAERFHDQAAQSG